MIKKICCFIIVLLCFLPSVSFANDAPAVLDTEKKVSIEFELLSRKAEVGGKFEFTLSLTNNTAKTIEDYMLLQLSEVFLYSPVAESDKEIFSNMPNLKPGEKLVLFLSMNVPESIYWYKKADGYYTDFHLLFYYHAWEINGDDIEDAWETEYYYESENIPIKLTNINDGSNLLKLDSVEKEDAFYFGDHFYADYDDAVDYLTSSVHSHFSASNISLYKLESITVRKENRYDNDIIFIDSIDSQQRVYYDFEYKNEAEHKVPIKLAVVYKAMFRLNNKYYASEFSKLLPAKVVKLPLLDVSAKSDPDNYKNFILSITNSSNEDYGIFYIDFSDGPPEVYTPDKIIYDFLSGQSIEYSIEIPEYSNCNFYIGYAKDNLFYSWSVDYYIDLNDNENEVISYISFKDVLNLDSDTDLFANPSPTPSPSPTVNSTLKPTANPSPTAAPTPSITVTPSPSPAESATPAITVTGVTKKPAVPLWVWIALGCALLATGLTSVLLNVVRTKKD